MSLLKKVIINSFHSQVPISLSKIDHEPEAIVSFDAHLDIHMGTKEILQLMPKDIRLAALRASSHTMIRRTFGELPLLQAQELSADINPDMFLATPEISLATHIFEVIETLQGVFAKSYVSVKEIEDPKQWFLDSLSRIWDIRLFTSPPKRLLDLINLLRGTDFLFDLDVDYLYEMQDECYTPLKKTGPSDLGRAEQLLRFIRKTKPSIITISEAKVSAIQDASSNFSMFIRRLKNFGYVVKTDKIFTDDKYAVNLIRTYEHFYRSIQKPLLQEYHKTKNFSDIKAYKKFQKELQKVAQKYFQSTKQQFRT